VYTSVGYLEKNVHMRRHEVACSLLLVIALNGQCVTVCVELGPNGPGQLLAPK